MLVFFLSHVVFRCILSATLIGASRQVENASPGSVREQRIAFTRENYRTKRVELLKIVYWKPDDATAGVPLRLEEARNGFRR